MSRPYRISSSDPGEVAMARLEDASASKSDIGEIVLQVRLRFVMP